MSGGIEPSQGPRYGMTSVTATHAPNSNAYCCACGNSPITASSHRPKPALVPMIRLNANWPRTYDASAFSIARSSDGSSRSRREPPIDPAAEPLHVEQHVDRHDEQEHRAEERLADRDRRAFDERDDPVRVLADVATLNLAHELVAALFDLAPTSDGAG